MGFGKGGQGDIVGCGYQVVLLYVYQFYCVVQQCDGCQVEQVVNDQVVDVYGNCCDDCCGCVGLFEV